MSPEDMAGKATSKLDELDLSGKEKDRLVECFKDKEFVKMFQDYCDEISDPKNREEYDKYIGMCERGEAEAPEGMQLMMPNEGICVKTKDTTPGAAVSKIFVNICHTEKVARGTCENVPGTGSNWSLPFSLDNPKPDVDSSDKPCLCHTIAFNTDTFIQFTKDERRTNFIIDVALENIEASRSLKLDRANFKIMRNTRFKGPGGKPTVMSVRKEDQAPAEEKKKAPGKSKKSQRKAAKAASAPPQLNPGFLSGGKKKKAAAAAESPRIEEITAAEDNARANGGGGVREPEHSMVHRGEFELSDHMQGGGIHGGANSRASRVQSCRPKELVVRVKLPLIASAAAVDLDVSEKALVLNVPGIYALDLPLPFPVDADHGRAKYDKGTKTMVVTLPVIAQAKPEEPFRPEPPEEEPEEEAAATPVAEEDEDEDEEDLMAEVEAELARKLEQSIQAAAPPAMDEAAAAVRGQPEATRAVAEGRHSEPATSAPPAGRAVGAGADSSAPRETFTQAGSFAGYREDYVFKLGPLGLGYYLEGEAACVQQQEEVAAAASPTNELGFRNTIMCELD